MKLASCKKALNPRWFILLTILRRWFQCKSYSLLLCVLFHDAICFSFDWCYFVLVFFSPFSIAIALLGEERATLSAFRTFVCFALVWFCLLPLPLGVWEGLRFVIVAHSLNLSLTFFEVQTFVIVSSSTRLESHRF